MRLEQAIFAGGCFWCIEHAFENHHGVVFVESGYTGGTTKNPTYESVLNSSSGHYEAVRITFNPEQTSYDELLDVFWRQIDPTDEEGQFADRGPQYRTAIFALDDEQMIRAESSKREIEQSNRFEKPIATRILRARMFTKAEPEHQCYATKNPERYASYYEASGRGEFCRRIWKIDSSYQLNDVSYEVTQKNGTEPAFSSELNEEWRDGIYVDIISGEALFSSKDKYDAGCGWPTFSKPIEEDSIQERVDTSHAMIRTEVRSSSSDSHLGHVFDEAGDKRRFCINGVALRFIPREDMVDQGYAEYIK